MKRHYKLYKSGKQWCCMALTAFAVMTAGMALHQTVQADTTNTSVSTEQISTLNQAQDDESTASEKQNTSVNQELNVSQASDVVKTPAENTVNAVDTTVPATKNGWYDENGQKVYYQNGQTKSGQDYAYLESMTNPQEKNWYMVKDGVALSGLQKWFGTYYYFDPVTYLKVTDSEVPVKWANGAVTPYRFDQTGALVQGLYADPAGHQYYSDPNTYLVVKNQRVDLSDGSSMIFGPDGQALKGLQHFNGALYYLDPATGRMVKHDYRTFNNDIHGYLFGENGQAQTSLQEWYGTYYYFDPETYQLVTDQYLPVHWANGDVTWYRFGKTGAIYTGLYRDGQAVYYFDPSTYLMVKNDFRIAEDGNGYMFGSDGKAISGLQKWYGTYYYFDPATYQMVKNNYIPVKWSNGETTWYMFGPTGSIVTGLYQWYGTYYYFSPDTYEKVINEYVPVTWSNGETTWYMFGKTGSIVTGLYQWYDSLYYFDPSTYEKVTSKVIYANGKNYWANSTGSLSPYEVTGFARRVQSFLNGYSNNSNIAMTFIDLSTAVPSFASINGDSYMYAASVGKLPIVAYVQELINSGKLSLDTTFQYNSAADYTADHMIKGGTGSLQYQNPEGKWYTVRELLTKDLIESDNAASNQLLYHVANANRKDFDSFLGRIAGIPSYSKYMTSNQVAKVMMYIHNQGGIANDLLSRTNWKNNKIGALPVRVDHKIGINGSINNDAAFVYASSPFVLVVMSNGYSDNAISNIAWNVYNMR